MFITPIDRYEIERFTQQIKNHTTFFGNGLTNRILKKNANTISYPLKKLFNHLISLDIYPSCFKRYIIVPIHKSGDPTICNNYRPITLSISLSKIFEKCLKSRIIIQL